MKPPTTTGLSPLPGELLKRLPEVEFDPDEIQGTEDAQRADLLRSALQVAGMNAVTEAALVREAVANALGALPAADE